MDYFFRAQWIFFFSLLCIIFLGMLLYHFYAKAIVFKHSLVSFIRVKQLHKNHPFKFILRSIRFVVLILLALLSSELQLVDNRSRLAVQGIDIMLVLDASGSMQIDDMGRAELSRFDCAKQEAIRFINNRPNDSCGLVLFANEVLTRCPITQDRYLLTSIIKDTQLGDISSDGTLLSSGIIAAANRLKNSKAKSTIMIVLTDGEPSQQDGDPSLAIQVAKELGIKIYTIGIGSEKAQFMMHPFYGPVQIPKVNVELLTRFAKETGGEFFLTNNEQGIREIYQIIDKLETTEREQNYFDRYYDLLFPLGFSAFCLYCLEIIVSATGWFSVCL